MEEETVINPKKFPLEYPLDVLNVIDAMTFSVDGLKIAGSMSLKSQLYAGDYDMFETVNLTGATLHSAIMSAVSGLKNIIKHIMNLPNCYIGDIKAGEIKEWKVIDGDIHRGEVVGYDYETSHTKLIELYKSGIITKPELLESLDVLKRNPTMVEFLIMEKTIRFHIIRWKPENILDGFVILQNGMKYKLESAITSPSIIKIDVVALVQNSRYTDFSNIFQFVWNDRILNEMDLDPKHEIKKNIVLYNADNEYFKLAKRMFAIFKMKQNNKMLGELTELFNSDLGRLYSIISDLGTIQFLIENYKYLPIERIRFELDQLRGRLSNVYTLKDVSKPSIFRNIIGLTSIPLTLAGRKKISDEIDSLISIFKRVLNKTARKELMKLRLLPLPPTMIP